MRINIQNSADLTNKNLRFIKWKLYQLEEKFSELIYAEIFLKSEGKALKNYLVNIRLGIPGKDIVLKEKSENLFKLFQNLNRKIYRNLDKKKRWSQFKAT